MFIDVELNRERRQATDIVISQQKMEKFAEDISSRNG